MSRRFSPELLNFLTGVVYLSAEKKLPSSPGKLVSFVAPFKTVGTDANLLWEALKQKP